MISVLYFFRKAKVHNEQMFASTCFHIYLVVRVNISLFYSIFMKSVIIDFQWDVMSDLSYFY